VDSICDKYSRALKENSSAAEYFLKLTSATDKTLVSKWKKDIERAEAVRESTGDQTVMDVMKNTMKKHKYFHI